MKKFVLMIMIGGLLLASCSGNRRDEDEGTSGFGERQDTLYEDFERSDIPLDTAPMPAPFDTVADTAHKH
ncbi:hypothetical protein [Olivibacter sitiensis]|uniref:hypothetical protein n=1 Tax=Olivibacter sitiensis TaxID=376470 RepID=UPI00048110D3|nr:hypothetical protein [Olivibacter sitiensis]